LQLYSYIPRTVKVDVNVIFFSNNKTENVRLSYMTETNKQKSKHFFLSFLRVFRYVKNNIWVSGVAQRSRSFNHDTRAIKNNARHSPISPPSPPCCRPIAESASPLETSNGVVSVFSPLWQTFRDVPDLY